MMKIVSIIIGILMLCSVSIKGELKWTESLVICIYILVAGALILVPMFI
jgi:hypothetical protein